MLLGRTGEVRAAPDERAKSLSAISSDSLLATTTDDGIEPDTGPPAHEAGADALGPVDLVRRDGHEVDVPLVNVDGDLADHLGGVGVEGDLLGAAELADLGHGLDHADLVVHGHHTDMGGVGSHGRFELFQVDQAVLLDGEVGDVEAFVLEMAAAVEYAFVLGLDGDDVFLLS